MQLCFQADHFYLEGDASNLRLGLNVIIGIDQKVYFAQMIS